LKGDLIKKNLTRENQKLFSRNKEWLKRLYPKNQPDVYLRLQKSFDDKEQRRMDLLKFREQRKWQIRSMTRNDDLVELQTNLEKALKSKSKKKLRLAQYQMV
jgi:hypothetical protein